MTSRVSYFFLLEFLSYLHFLFGLVMLSESIYHAPGSGQDPAPEEQLLGSVAAGLARWHRECLNLNL